MIGLLVITDGRGDYLARTLQTAHEHLVGLDGPRLLFDDSGDRTYRHHLCSTYRDQFDRIGWHPSGRRHGQAATIVAARRLMTEMGAELVFHLEDDFEFFQAIPLHDMAAVLGRRPYLAQMALLRQAWFPSELRAGGIIERHPDEYTPVTDGPARWFEHRLWFTLNPCLYRAELADLAYPAGRRHEWRFSRQLCTDPDVKFGLWGDGRPWVHHIGARRAVG
jgi:hypothetical protein